MSVKTSFAPICRYESFYKGGKVQATSDGQHMFCLCETQVNMLNIETGRVDKVFSQDDGDVSCFVLSPDNKYLVVANNDLLLSQWELETKEVFKWKSQHECPVTCMSFDPTSTLMATGSTDSTVRVWDIHKRYLTNILRGHLGIVSVVEFHPNSSLCWLLTASDDYKIRVWNLLTHECIAELTGHFSAIRSLRFQNNGDALYSASRDSTVFVWNMKSVATKGIPERKTISVYEPLESIILLPKDGANSIPNVNSTDDYVVTAGNQGVLKIWNVTKSTCIHSVKETSGSLKSDRAPEADAREHAIVHADYIKALDMLYTVTYDCNIIFYNRKDLSKSKQFSGNLDEVYCIKFLGEDDSHIAVASNSSAIKVFAVYSWSCQILRGHTDLVLTLDACVIDGTSYLISGAKDNTVRIWSMNKETNLLSCLAVGIGHSHNVTAVAFLGDSTLSAVSAAKDMSVKQWTYSETSSGHGKLRVKHTSAEAHKKDINTIAVSPKCKYIATGSQDKTAKLWCGSSLSVIAVLGGSKGHSRGVNCARFSPTDSILATSSADHLIKLWELKEFTCVMALQSHESSVTSFAYLSNGMQILSCGADGLVKLWLIQKKECIKTYDEHNEKTWTLAVNKKEDRFISGGLDSKIILWKDQTEVEKETERKKTEDFVLNEQKLMNLLQQQEYGEALKLTILLNQPFRALTILKDMWKMPTHTEDLNTALRSMRRDQIQSILEFASEWNSNSKHSHIAQAVLHAVFQMYSPDELLKFPVIKKLVQNFLPYTERHHKRVKELEMKTEFISYACQLVSTPVAMDME